MKSFTRAVTVASLLLNSGCAAAGLVGAGGPVKLPLASSDIDQIAQLVMLEDQRRYDSVELGGLLAAQHPEVRRRAAQSVGRINDKRGVALLFRRGLESDTAVAATVVWAVGQLRDTATVRWFDSLLSVPALPPTLAAEATTALGKIKTPAARAALAKYLARTPANPNTVAALGQALFAMGRATQRGDIAPVVRWTTSSNNELRYRATWVLARTKDPAGVATLLTLLNDKTPLVRSWALRGLTRAQADSAGLASRAEAALTAAVQDPERIVRVEAVRSLGTYSTTNAVLTLIRSLESSDSWLSVSAAEALGNLRASAGTLPLINATRPGHSCALRITAMQALQKYQPVDAIKAAVSMARDEVPHCRTLALQTLRSNANIPLLPAAGTAERKNIDALLADTTLVPRATPRPTTTAPTPRTVAEYRQLVVKWIVPAYRGVAPPLVRWTTPRGDIELVLAPADAPLGVEEFMRIVESGALVGTTFTRVVPDFVDQQETIRGANRLRDEVNRRLLTKGNLAWASSGLDTGRPGYTLNHTDQPHNEGDFTAMGIVVRGQDAVDRIELGDRILAVKVLRSGLK